MSPATLTAVAVMLLAFGGVKLWIAGAAVRRRRVFLAGVPGSTDPSAGHRSPWMFWAWVGWRVAAAALAIGAACWLLAR